MHGILDRILARLVAKGDLDVAFADGTRRRYGDGTGEPIAIRFRDAATERRVTLDPELALGEAYMDGGLVVERGTVYDLLVLFMHMPQGTGPDMPAWMRAGRWWRYLRRRLNQHNPMARARRNVAHHYDLDSRLYNLFLDSDRQYSCAYFEDEDSTLEDAQLAKKRHLAAKLRVEPNQSVLDIGCGWGGLGLYLARHCAAAVTGVTLSREQHAIAEARASEEDVGERARFLLEDYRTLEGPFDRIVSVGMFEHVGIGHYREFFTKTRDLLAEKGVMVLHAIGRFDGPGATNPWVDKYIFPGGYIPALSEVLPMIERSGLIVTDVEILRLHYARTLRAWRERFLARWDEARRVYDERFCRMWEFYLAGSECAFRSQGMMVFQIQIARDQEAMPLTRDYIGRAEARLRARETLSRAAPMRIAGE